MVAELIDLDTRRHGRKRTIGEIVIDGFKFWRAGLFRWALDCVGRFPGGASDEDIGAIDRLHWGLTRIPCRTTVVDRRSDGRVVFRVIPFGFIGWLRFQSVRRAVSRQQLLRFPTSVAVESSASTGARRTWPFVFRRI